jgi:hypothetical protein
MKRDSRRPLWTCPRCGLKFVTRNLWHSCGNATLDGWRARMGPRARALYDRFEAMIAKCGEYHVSPAKTRIAFLGRVRFAGVTGLSERGMTCAFALPDPLRSERFISVREVAPGWWSHRLRITEPGQLDRQVQSWLRASYRLMGMQGRLRERSVRRPRARAAARPRAAARRER